MKLRFSVLGFTVALAAMLMAPRAHAQVNLYFNPIVTRVSNSQPDTGPFAFLGQNQTSQIFGGVMFGGGYDFYHSGKFDAGIDLRDEIEHGNSASLNSLLIGLRLAARPAGTRFKPYLQISGGEGRSRSPLSPVPATKGELAVFAGVDYPLSKHVDFRVLELGYGSVTTISSALYSGPVAIPAARLINFSTGFVFHIP